MKLVLGVVDIPYAGPAVTTPKVSKARKGKASKPRKPSIAGTATTGSVAEALEAKYHIMQHFAERHGAFIEQQLVASVEAAIHSLSMGGPADIVPTAEAEGKIQEKFRVFLDTEEMAQTGEPGVPTKAALEGISSRLKSGRGPRRPSFIDTHMYQDSMKVWTE